MIIIVVTVIIILPILGTLLDWSSTQPNEGPRVSYKIFKTSYAINPERWNYSDGYLYFLSDTSWHASSKRVKYSYLDWWRLRSFFLKINKREVQKQHREQTAELLAVIQQDVEEEINKSKKEVEQANRMMKDSRAPRSSGDTSCQEVLQISRPQDSRYHIYTDPVSRDQHITFPGHDGKTYVMRVPSHLDRSDDRIIWDIFEKKEQR